MEQQTLKDLHEKELHTLLRFSSIINTSLNIEDVLNYAMQWAEEFINAEASSVYELDEEEGLLFIRIARGEKKEPVKKIKIKVGEGVAGRVVQTGRPMVIHDVSKDKIFNGKIDSKTGFTTKSMLCVPLLLRDKPIGALQVLNKKSGESFNDTDLELLTSMSQQIAVALDNAKLYGRLEQKFQMTEQELKTTQKKLIRSERLAAIGHLVQGVAHEIRNPITAIGGFSARLKKQLEQESHLHSYIDIILDETRRLEDLVNEVREFASIQSAEMHPEDIKNILDQVCSRFKEQARNQNVKLSAAIDDGLPLVTVDKSQITLALSNIIENALECMPNGGVLAIDARHKDDYVVTKINDSGCGIAPEDLDSVYDPFFTSKTRGAGMGLTMVHQIMINHDGEIKLKSKTGKGTTVTLRLPVKNQKSGPHEETGG